MDNLEKFEKEMYRAKNYISNISLSIVKIDAKLEELKKSKKKTDDLIEKFNIDCFEYNLVEELVESRNNLVNNVNIISKKIKSIKVEESSQKEKYLKKICIINDLFDKLDTQIKAIDKEQLAEIENLQMNAIKYAIYKKYMVIKCTIDREKLKSKFDKIYNRNLFVRAYERFFELEEEFDRRKENLFFAIKEIDEAKQRFEINDEPSEEYKIVDIVADMNLFLKDVQGDKSFKKEISEIYKLKSEIYATFIINDKDLKTAMKAKQKTRLPVEINKKMNKTLRERRKAILYLTRNGYIKNEETECRKSYMKLIIEKLNLISKNIENADYDHNL